MMSILNTNNILVMMSILNTNNILGNDEHSQH